MDPEIYILYFLSFMRCQSWNKNTRRRKWWNYGDTKGFSSNNSSNNSFKIQVHENKLYIQYHNEDNDESTEQAKVQELD
jgi:hypothetical protein